MFRFVSFHLLAFLLRITCIVIILLRSLNYERIVTSCFFLPSLPPHSIHPSSSERLFVILVKEASNILCIVHPLTSLFCCCFNFFRVVASFRCCCCCCCCCWGNAYDGVYVSLSHSVFIHLKIYIFQKFARN